MDLHEKCIKLWEYLHETGSKDKGKAYRVLEFTEDVNYCPACQYTFDIKGSVDCSICPVRGSWVMDNGEGFCYTCSEFGSSYRHWESSHDIPESKKLLAGYVLESVRDWWEEEE